MRSTRLYGGHRNDVFRTDGIVKIVWRDPEKRLDAIREGVLLENFIGTHTDIISRILVDKSKPIQEEHGKLVTYFRYVEGGIRYPWNEAEIASAAKLLGKLHRLLKDGPSAGRTVLSLQLHLDFARGNVLFKKNSSDAIGVIDFETTGTGHAEQDLGRTLSFVLADTPVDIADPRRASPAGRFTPYGLRFSSRLDVLLTNYPLPYKREEALRWTSTYLESEDYGDLNGVRGKAMEWLNKK